MLPRFFEKAAEESNWDLEVTERYLKKNTRTYYYKNNSKPVIGITKISGKYANKYVNTHSLQILLPIFL